MKANSQLRWLANKALRLDRDASDDANLTAWDDYYVEAANAILDAWDAGSLPDPQGVLAALVAWLRDGTPHPWRSAEAIRCLQQFFLDVIGNERAVRDEATGHWGNVIQSWIQTVEPRFGKLNSYIPRIREVWGDAMAMRQNRQGLERHVRERIAEAMGCIAEMIDGAAAQSPLGRRDTMPALRDMPADPVSGLGLIALLGLDRRGVNNIRGALARQKRRVACNGGLLEGIDYFRTSREGSTGPTVLYWPRKVYPKVMPDFWHRYAVARAAPQII